MGGKVPLSGEREGIRHKHQPIKDFCSICKYCTIFDPICDSSWAYTLIYMCIYENVYLFLILSPIELKRVKVQHERTKATCSIFQVPREMEHSQYD